MLRIARIDYQGPCYTEWLAVRHAELRAPLGLEFTPEQLARDEKDILLAAFWNDAVAGTLIVHHIDAREAKLRQMAVAQEHQGKQIGSALMAHAEGLIMDGPYRLVSLHARQSAVGFYEKHGYRTVGEPFIEMTLPHLRMEKFLYQQA